MEKDYGFPVLSIVRLKHLVEFLRSSAVGGGGEEPAAKRLKAVDAEANAEANAAAGAVAGAVAGVSVSVSVGEGYCVGCTVLEVLV